MDDFVPLFTSRAGVEDVGAETSPARAWEEPRARVEERSPGPFVLGAPGGGRLPSRLWRGEAQSEMGEEGQCELVWVSGARVLLVSSARCLLEKRSGSR